MYLVKLRRSPLGIYPCKHHYLAWLTATRGVLRAYYSSKREAYRMSRKRAWSLAREMGLDLVRVVKARRRRG